MNGTHSIQTATGSVIPELIIDSQDIIKRGLHRGRYLR